MISSHQLDAAASGRGASNYGRARPRWGWRAAICTFLAVASAMPVGLAGSHPVSDYKSPDSDGLIAQEHPQRRYRVRPPGLPVRVLRETAQPASGGAFSITRQLESATMVARFGVESGQRYEMFGQVGNVVIDARDVIYILDRSFFEIRAFGSRGEFLGSIGQPGQGPGEFVTPLDLALDAQTDSLLVADGNHRVHVFKLRRDQSPQEMSASYERSISTLMWPERVCALDHHLVVHGMRLAEPRNVNATENIGGRILHLVTRTGDLERSFGSVYESPSGLINHQLYAGFIACDSTTARVYFAPEVGLGEVWAFDVGGDPLWVAEIGDFKPVLLEERPPGGSFVGPPRDDGSWNGIESLILLGGNYLLLQVARYWFDGERNRTTDIRSFLVATDDGVGTYVGNHFPLIVAANDTYFVTVTREPNPEFTVWERGRQPQR